MTICTGPIALTPVCQIVKLPATAANDAFSNMAGWFGKAADQATSWLWVQIGSATAINLDSPQLRTDLLATGAIAVTLTLALFLVQVIASVLRREPAGLGRAAKGLLIALMMSGFAFSVIKILLGVVDQLSEGVVSYTMGTDIAGLGKRLALGSIAGVANPGLVLIFSLVILAAVAVVWGAMMIRKMLVIIAAVLTPMAFSGATADITRGLGPQVDRVHGRDDRLQTAAGHHLHDRGLRHPRRRDERPTGPGQQLTQMATGSLILLLAGFAPWAAIKMFHFTGDALHTAHATAMAAPSGTRTVLSAPQKVNVMHSQASHAAAKLSGSGPRTPAGTHPPRDSADMLNEKPILSGHPGGPASPAVADRGLPAATAAKPVGSAAGSSATGAGSSAAAANTFRLEGGPPRSDSQRGPPSPCAQIWTEPLGSLDVHLRFTRGAHRAPAPSMASGSHDGEPSVRSQEHQRMSRLTRTTIRRLSPRATVVSGAALGLLAGAAVYGAVSSSAALPSHSAPKAAKAPAAAAPATFANCAAGAKLEKGVCVIHVVRTVVAGPSAASVAAAAKAAHVTRAIGTSSVKPLSAPKPTAVGVARKPATAAASSSAETESLAPAATTPKPAPAPALGPIASASPTPAPVPSAAS